MKSSSMRKPAQSPLQLLLRIQHPTLDPSEITHELQLPPEHTVAVGESTSTNGRARVQSESYWLAVLPVPPVGSTFEWAADSMPALKEPQARTNAIHALSMLRAQAMDGQVSLWLFRLMRHRDFFKRIAEQQGSVTLMVQRALRTAPVAITPYLARQLADLNIRLEID